MTTQLTTTMDNHHQQQQKQKQQQQQQKQHQQQKQTEQQQSSSGEQQLLDDDNVGGVGLGHLPQQYETTMNNDLLVSGAKDILLSVQSNRSLADADDKNAPGDRPNATDDGIGGENMSTENHHQQGSNNSMQTEKPSDTMPSARNSDLQSSPRGVHGSGGGGGGGDIVPPPVAVVAATDGNHHSANEHAGNKTKRTLRNIGPSDKTKSSHHHHRDRSSTREHHTKSSSRAAVKRKHEQKKISVGGLKAKKAEALRQRRIRLKEKDRDEKIKKEVLTSFLQYHCANQCDESKWGAILEDTFCCTQPVTPYRYFRRSEVENGSRISRGVSAMVADSASIAVMTECIGSGSSRWTQVRREAFLRREQETKGSKKIPRSILRNDSRWDPSVSSVSSNSVSSVESAEDRDYSKQSTTASSPAGNVSSKPSPSKASKNLDCNKTGSNNNVAPNAAPATTIGGKLRQTKNGDSTASSITAGDEGEQQDKRISSNANNPSNNLNKTDKRSGHKDEKGAITKNSSDKSVKPVLYQRRLIQVSYHVKLDEMIVMNDIIQCKFTHVTQNAVSCGAHAECMCPGMLFAKFSKNNKLQSIQMMFDSMGYMAQLSVASGRNGLCETIPSRLDVALSQQSEEAQAITLATRPFAIVSVNSAWIRLMKYTQLEVEGTGLLDLLGGDGEGNNDEEEEEEDGDYCKNYEELDEVANRGRCMCFTSNHYKKNRKQFIDFVCCYPLTNSYDEISHILFVCKNLSSWNG